MSEGKILVVDDDTRILNLIDKYLLNAGYQTVLVSDGKEALDQYKHSAPDLIILDMLLPNKHGLEILSEIREQDKDVPVLILSVENADTVRIQAFKFGADDYVNKPFNPKEVVLRVNAILKRSGLRKELPHQPIIELGDIKINHDNRRVTILDTEVNLTPKEFDLLSFLIENPDQVFTREQLIQKVWNYDTFDDLRTVDTHIKRLREKIKKVSEPTSKQIRTIWGRGYSFDT